jgi:hypothetical protein
MSNKNNTLELKIIPTVVLCAPRPKPEYKQERVQKGHFVCTYGLGGVKSQLCVSLVRLRGSVAVNSRNWAISGISCHVIPKRGLLYMAPI